MKAPKVSTSKASFMANEHPIKLAKGGDIDASSVKTMPKGFDPNKLTHYLQPGEKPMDGDMLTALGYKVGKSENEYITPSGDYVHYKPIMPGTTNYNVAENPYYQVPQMPITASTDTKFKPKYPKIGTPEWDENQKVIESERQKRISGTQGLKNGGGIKGYLAGGDIRPEEQKSASFGNREYSTKPKDYLHDFIVGNADAAIGGVAPNAVKDKNYKTKAGSTFNQGMYGVNTIGTQVSGAVLNYFVPGVGTAAAGASKGANGLMGEDTGLDKNTKAKQDKAAGVIGTIGTATSGLSGLKKTNKKAEEETAATNTEIQNAPISVNNTNISTAETGISAGNSSAPLTNYDEYDTSVMSADQLSVWNTLTPAQKGAFLKTEGLAEGGQIKGKGTGKSDSISATLDDGGFIVPAENAEKAKAIREQYLGTEGNQKAPLENGDIPVKVSNGEHYFTKEEKAYLLSQGVDLSSLAPNAKKGNALAEGGPVKKKSKNDELVSSSEKKINEEKVKKIKKDYIDIEVEKRLEEENKKYNKNKKVVDLANNLTKLNALYEAYTAIKNNPKSSKTDISNARKELLYATGEPISDRLTGETNDLATEQAFVNGSNRIKKEIKGINPDYKATATKVASNGKSNYFDSFAEAVGQKGNKKPGSAIAETIKPSAATKKDSASPIGANGTLPKKPSSAVSSSLKDVTFTPPSMDDADIANSDKQAEDLKQTLASQEPKVDPNVQTPTEKKLEAGALAAQAKEPTQTTDNKPKFDTSRAFSAFQVGQGVNQLLKDGKRPVDSLPADYSAVVEQAKAETLYGISPQERSIAERGIERNRRSDVQNIMNLSGGNAGMALANIRAAGMGADEQLNNLSMNSEKLRLEKQKYYASLVADKAEKSRRLFEDKLNAFNTNQQAGAALVGAGIRNWIGGDRYAQELKAQEDAAKLSKVTVNV